jgi:hypothetical protein
MQGVMVQYQGFVEWWLSHPTAGGSYQKHLLPDAKCWLAVDVHTASKGHHLMILVYRTHAITVSTFTVSTHQDCMLTQHNEPLHDCAPCNCLGYRSLH